MLILGSTTSRQCTEGLKGGGEWRFGQHGGEGRLGWQWGEGKNARGDNLQKKVAWGANPPIPGNRPL